MNKHDKMYQKITKHGEQLNAIFNTGLDPVTLSKKLRRIEVAAQRNAENLCNIPDHPDERDKLKKRLFNLLGDSVPMFVNGDPRGYALKIDSDYVREHNLKIQTDWGGYGILSPDFSEE